MYSQCMWFPCDMKKTILLDIQMWAQLVLIYECSRHNHTSYWYLHMPDWVKDLQGVFILDTGQRMSQSSFIWKRKSEGEASLWNPG
jgi:hypothetical protein